MRCEQNVTANTTTPVQNAGPPYLPNTALVGGVPVPNIDDPVSAVLTFLFLVAAAAHMAVFQINKKRQHVFVFSAMMFAFSLIRAVALILRMALASHQTNARLAIAANILTQAGTILVFLVNLFFAQRMVRGYHPKFGWSTLARILFRFFLASVVLSLLMIIMTTVQSTFTLNEAIRAADRKVQLFGGTYLTVLAFLPIPVVVLSIITPRRYVIEKFGTGSWRAKLFLLLFTSAIMTLGAGFRVGTNYAPRPANDPAWYHGRGPYYAFNYILDLIVAYLYLASGFHKRFYIPDGAKGPGSYMGTLPVEKAGISQRMSHGTSDTTFQSAETLTQSGPAPSPIVKGSKLPIGHVGYNDSVSSLKNQKKRQRNRLSKTNSKQQRYSGGSIASQTTYVGSAAPSIAETAAHSLPGSHRGSAMTRRYSDYSTSGSMDPPVLPPVPMLPTSVEGLYGYNTSREGTILEEQDDKMTGAVRDGHPTGALGERQNAVLDDMLGKIDGVRNSRDDGLEQPTSDGHAHAHGYQTGSAERTSNELRLWNSRDVEMSGAAGAHHHQHPQQHMHGVYENSSDARATSSASSRYETDNCDGFESEISGRGLRLM